MIQNNNKINPKTQSLQMAVSGSYDPVLKLIKKYHEIGMELLKRKKATTDVIDIGVIDLQILTNERFITDLTALLVDLG
jgi:uncharacterized protein YqgV (UPF0045/DUF77 family)